MFPLVQETKQTLSILTSNISIYSPPTVSSPLGNSDPCPIALRHDFLPHLDRAFAPQRVFHYSKADWDTLNTFYSSYPWSSGFSNDPSSFASFITNAILHGMDLFIPSSYKHDKKNSPKWLNSLRPLIASGTRVFSLNYRCWVSITLSLIGLVVSSLIGQLPSEWTASSLICTQSILVCPRALSTPLYSSSSS